MLTANDFVNYFFLTLGFVTPLYYNRRCISTLFKLFYLRKTVAIVNEQRSETENSLFGSYAFQVRYEVNGKAFDSFLKGYATPFHFSLLENVSVFFYKKNPAEIYPASYRGLSVKIILRLSLIVLMTFSIYDSIRLIIGDQNEDQKFISVPIIFCVISLIMLINSFVLRFTLLRKSDQTNGVIKRFEKAYDAENSVVFKPVVVYYVNQSTYQFQSSILFYDTRSAGKNVVVRYLKKFPQFAEINSFESLFLEILFWLLVFILSSVATYLMSC